MSLDALEREWDVIVVGGGITGAGIFRQAIHMGYKTLLVEKRDFAWGTSSRSSKLVHGGLRYLKEGRVNLVRDSVVERQNLLREAPGLVEPLAFLVPDYKGQYPPPLLFRAGLLAYDALAGKLQHDWLDREQFTMAAPHMRREGLTGGGRFLDAQVDDARLVLRVLLDGERQGGQLLNYTQAQLPHRDESLTRLTLVQGSQRKEVSARVVFSATGAWADAFQERRPGRLRPLRGSHIVFPSWKLPLPCALSFTHPEDGRPTFLVPWEGASFCGTTDLDHDPELDQEPFISLEEIGYLMRGVRWAVPHLGLEESDIITSWAGVRPVISQGKDVDPSKETRDHAIWDEDGVITMTGGKLTTFRLMAREALRKARRYLGAPQQHSLFGFESAPCSHPQLSASVERRLSGRYGQSGPSLLEAAEEGELQAIPGTHFLWAELRWAARAEKVEHLEDLLLRRTRLGFLLPGGGSDLMARIKEICLPELGWTKKRWNAEEKAYLKLWAGAYSPRPTGSG